MATGQRAGEIALQPTALFLYSTKVPYVLSRSQVNQSNTLMRSFYEIIASLRLENITAYMLALGWSNFSSEKNSVEGMPSKGVLNFE